MPPDRYVGPALQDEGHLDRSSPHPADGLVADANAIARAQAVNLRPGLFDDADDLMPGNKRKPGIWCVYALARLATEATGIHNVSPPSPVRGSNVGLCRSMIGASATPWPVGGIASVQMAR